MSVEETHTTSNELYERLLMQEILTQLQIIRKEQIQHGKDIQGLQIRTGIIGALSGIVSGFTSVFAFFKFKLLGG